MSDHETKKDFLRFWEHIPWKSQDETLIVLKGHLLVEDLLREYCASKVNDESELKKAKLSFTQAMRLTKALQQTTTPSWVWGGMGKLNSLRNDLAHVLVPSDYVSKRDDFIDFVKSQIEANEGLYEAFSGEFEHLGVSIFEVYTALSVSLRFKPQGLLASALQSEE